MHKLLIAAALCAACLTPAHAQQVSYYGGRHHGLKMANGQRFDQNSDSCAHKTLPFGTRLQVTVGSRSIVCVVRDRGPYVRGRVVDVSVAGARTLGILGRGVAPVSIRPF